MDSKYFGKIRSFMGKTQEELAQLLCVSRKTVQSYEHVWRKIPSITERQMLLLLAVKSSSDMYAPPCWEIKNCPDEWRDNCIVWELKFRRYCWFMNGTFCQGKLRGSWDNKIRICRECEVFTRDVPDIWQVTLD